MKQGRLSQTLRGAVLVAAIAAGAMVPAIAVNAEVAKPAAAVATIPAKVNINTASADVLAAGLNGVGPAKAEAIVAYRKQFGAFESVDELLEVKGIGPSLLEQNRDRIVLK